MERVGGHVWSVPFAGATIERGAEFILPHDRELIAAARRLGLTLVRKGTLYGDREPRGGEPVSRAQVVAAIDQIRPRCRPSRARMFMARSRAPVSAAAWRTRSRRGWRSAATAPMTWTSVVRDGAGSFGDFDTHTVQGGNDRIAGALAESLGDAVRLSWR